MGNPPGIAQHSRAAHHNVGGHGARITIPVQGGGAGGSIGIAQHSRAAHHNVGGHGARITIPVQGGGAGDPSSGERPRHAGGLALPARRSPTVQRVRARRQHHDKRGRRVRVCCGRNRSVGVRNRSSSVARNPSMIRTPEDRSVCSAERKRLLDALHGDHHNAASCLSCRPPPLAVDIVPHTSTLWARRNTRAAYTATSPIARAWHADIVSALVQCAEANMLTLLVRLAVTSDMDADRKAPGRGFRPSGSRCRGGAVGGAARRRTAPPPMTIRPPSAPSSRSLAVTL